MLINSLKKFFRTASIQSLIRRLTKKRKKKIVFPSVTFKDPKELILFTVSLDSMLQDLEELKKRDTNANSYIGAFLGQVLAIEKKIDLALRGVHPEIEGKTLGGKIIALEQFLNHLSKTPDGEISGYNAIRFALPSLKEIRDVRNKFSHDFNFIYCPTTELTKTITFINSWDAKYAAEKIRNEPNDHIKSLLAVTVISRVLCEKLSYLAFCQK